MSEAEFRLDPGPPGSDARSPDPPRSGRGRRDPAAWRRLERGWWIVVLVTMAVFSAFPIANLLLGLSTKDYGLWYQVGRAERQGMEVYPRPETGRLFPFMYPPSAAAMLGFVSVLGPIGTVLALVLVNSVAWVVCIRLSVWLAAGPGERRHPLVVIVPSVAVMVLVYNIYLLGQPNLLLLAMVLGAFACLRLGRDVAAGALVATAAAIKAFPILILGYLVYRRMWTAAVATVLVLAGWLLIAPLPFRTPGQAVEDLVVWSRGMLFTYNTHGIAQRPLRSYSYKNQSIMAVAHRLLRAVPADGEAVLSRRAAARPGGPRPPKGLSPLDSTTDLLAFLKPHHRPDGSIPDLARRAGAAGGPWIRGSPGTTAEAETPATADARVRGGPGQRWDNDLKQAQSALRAAWRVNLLDLDFRAVTAITLAAMLALCGFVAAVMPPPARRTRETDALEFALVTLLTLIFSPLSFNYAYVWLLYPTTLALHRVLNQPPVAEKRARRYRLEAGWMIAVLFLPALAIPMPQVAQACGNLFVPAVLLIFGLGAMLRGSRGRGPGENVVPPAHRGHREDRDARVGAAGLRRL